ncbi:MAG TPA: RDD family protein [Polyangiaceae bacterium]|nr:RDD family protein [Polyangiaceae bacterium]
MGITFGARVSPARPRRRALAFAIDFAFNVAVLGGAVAALLLHTRGPPSSDAPADWPELPGVFLLVAALTYGRDSIGGRSLGRRLLGLQLVAPDGSPAGIWRCAAYNLLLANWFPIALGQLFVVGTTFSERIVGVRVVERGAVKEPTPAPSPPTAFNEPWDTLGQGGLRTLILAVNAAIPIAVGIALVIVSLSLPNHPVAADGLPEFRIRAIRELAALEPGETIELFCAQGSFDVAAGMSLLTDRRLLFKGPPGSDTKSLSLREVTQVELKLDRDPEATSRMSINGGALELTVSGGKAWAERFQSAVLQGRDRALSTPPDEWSDADSPIPLGKSDPIWGSRTAPVTIVVFAEHEDARCEHDDEPCRHDLGTPYYLVHVYGVSQLRVAWKNRTSGAHPDAPSAGEVGQGFFVLGGQRGFWDFALSFQAYRVYTRPPPRLPTASTNDYLVLAERLKLGARAALAQGLASHRWQGKVDEDVALAEKLGASRTPTYFVNGVRVVGARETDEFKRIVDAQLAEAQAALASGTSPERIYVEMSRRNFERGATAAPPPVKETRR